MRIHLLFFLVVLLLPFSTQAQVFLDQFDDGMTDLNSAGFTYSEADGELTISGDGTGGPFDPVYIGLGGSFDNSETKTVFVRAKASALGTQLRLDVINDTGESSNVAPVTRVLTADYLVLEYDLTDAGGPDYDHSTIEALLLFINPGVGAFDGDIILDYIALGEDVDGVIMSDIFQDHFDSDSSITSFIDVPGGYTVDRDANDGTLAVLTGDGSGEPWTPFYYDFRSPTTYEGIDIDLSEGDNKVYFRARASVPNTTLRVDIQDVDMFVSTDNAVTKILADTFKVFEYDLTGATNGDVPGTPCTAATAPCPLDLSRIVGMVMFVNPGTGAFGGTIEIDWVSVGVSLEPVGPEAPLVYSDHFDNDTLDFTMEENGYSMEEIDSEWIINGDGATGEFSTFYYGFHEGSEPTTVDFSEGGNKLYIKALTSPVSHSRRVDLLDTTGLVTNLNSVSKVVGTEYTVFEFDYEIAYLDAGYGGAGNELGCTVDVPCAVDPSVIEGLLFYVDPGTGMFADELRIDFLSVGQPIDDIATSPVGVINYSDDLDGAETVLSNEIAGIDYSVTDGELLFSGDGTSGAFQVVFYSLRDENNDPQKADVINSNNTLYLRAKTTGEAALRVDLIDENNFHSNLAGGQVTLTNEEYEVFEIVYSNYMDGGFGGTACAAGTGPCPVDGQRITQLGFYLDADNGGFDEDVTIDWISFGEPLTVSVRDFVELDQLRVFPNPAKEQLGIEYDLVSNVTIEFALYDTYGRRVLRSAPVYKTAGNQFDRLDLSNLTTGIYHLQLRVDGRPVRAMTINKQ